MTRTSYPSKVSATPWAAPNVDHLYTNVPNGAMPSTGLGDPHFAVTVEWEWPNRSDWTLFNIVRSVRSPASRFEEGSPMLFDSITQIPVEGMAKDEYLQKRNDGTPFYVDPQPPPGEWTYYTLFYLTTSKVWVRGSSALCIGPSDFDWTLRLPEFLPGVSVSIESGVTHPADQSSTAVQFMQSPALQMDIAITMAEAMQYFWDPLKAPPQFLKYIARSHGYEYDETVGIGRNREIIKAVTSPAQGSVRSINRMANAAMGSECSVFMSNNLMLNMATSSFETGSLEDSMWSPTSGLELWDYESNTDVEVVARPNISLKYFLYVPGPRKLWCGRDDPMKHGIPCRSWEKVRMGCYAYDRQESPDNLTTTLTMGMDFYDHTGKVLIDSVVVLPEQTLTDRWAWYGNDETTYPAVDLSVDDRAYGVPWLEVSNACCIDLIVVDDG